MDIKLKTNNHHYVKKTIVLQDSLSLISIATKFAAGFLFISEAISMLKNSQSVDLPSIALAATSLALSWVMKPSKTKPIECATDHTPVSRLAIPRGGKEELSVEDYDFLDERLNFFFLSCETEEEEKLANQAIEMMKKLFREKDFLSYFDFINILFAAEGLVKTISKNRKEKELTKIKESLRA